jgi:hypothetical protein
VDRWHPPILPHGRGQAGLTQAGEWLVCRDIVRYQSDIAADLRARGAQMTADPPNPPEPPEAPVPPPEDPVALLVQAVGTLPGDQRDLVLAWLIRERPLGYGQEALRGFTETHRVLRGEKLTRAAFDPVFEPILGTGSMRAAGATGQQVVPVRFPAEQHAQLREWCAEHGFSMATVIRGLVARFLESQTAV